MLRTLGSITRRTWLAGVGGVALRLARSASGQARETLYNGIVLPSPWPPRDGRVDRTPVEPPYLASPPPVVPIDTGRQLFVDDFLIEESTVQREFHAAQYYPANPILTPREYWEQRDPYAAITGAPTSQAAMVFSDGVFFDPRERLFKLWYMGGYQQYTCLAISEDGLDWRRPNLDVARGTNIVDLRHRDSNTVWLDHAATQGGERFKMASYDLKLRRLRLSVSADGVHWRDAGTSGPCGDRSTVFFNPFRQQWIFSLRAERGDGSGRYRRYFEAPRFAGAAWADGVPVPWVGADADDIPRADYGATPELYNLDAVAYESLMLGLFTMYRGERAGREKPNDLVIGFSRDGFHWSRPSRQPFIGVSEQEGDWNWGNVQSAGGCCVVVGDRLHFYVSGRTGVKGTSAPGICSTGLATLRRDGFASLTDVRDPRRAARVFPSRPHEIVTRPVRFTGSHLFVNAAVERSLRTEVLDRDGRVLEPYSLEHSVAVHGDRTQHPVRWQRADSLRELAGEVVRFRFVLDRARLYAFWVSASAQGTSGGYVAAGGPGFASSIDR